MLFRSLFPSRSNFQLVSPARHTCICSNKRKHEVRMRTAQEALSLMSKKRSITAPERVTAANFVSVTLATLIIVGERASEGSQACAIGTV